MYGKILTVQDVIKTLMVLGFFMCSCMASSPSQQLENESYLDQLEGKWWAVAAVPPKGPTPSNCIHLNFTLAPGNLHLEMKAIGAISRKHVTFIANIATNNMTGPWRLVQPPIQIGSWKHTFLAIEKSCAALIISDPNENHLAKPKHALILSRTKALDEITLDRMKKAIGQHIEENKIVNVKQDMCYSHSTTT